MATLNIFVISIYIDNIFFISTVPWEKIHHARVDQQIGQLFTVLSSLIFGLQIAKNYKTVVIVVPNKKTKYYPVLLEPRSRVFLESKKSQ